jgi:hypothetical protein
MEPETMLYEPVAEHVEVLRILEADGSKWRVRVLRYGRSKNGWYWDADSGRALLPFLGSAPVGLYQFPNGSTAHAPDEAVLEAKGAVMRNIVADLQNPALEPDGVYADLHVHEDAGWLKQKLVGLERRGVLERVLGLSVDTIAGYIPVQMADGLVKKIREVKQLISVDIVTAPSADGRFLRAAAGPLWPQDDTPSAPERHTSEGSMDIKKDDKQQTLDDAVVREAQEQAQLAVKEAQTALAAVKAQQAELAKVTEGLRTEQEKLAITNSDQAVAVAVAATRLPAPMKADLVKQLQGTVREAEMVAARIAEAEKLWQALTPPPQPMGSGARIEMGVESADKMQAGLNRLFGLDRDKTARAMESAPFSPNTVARITEASKASDEAARGDAGLGFTSIKQAYIAYTGDTGLTFRVPRSSGRISEASVITTTWSDALGNTLHRRLVAAYLEQQYNEQTIVRFGTAPDFRTREVVHLGYFPDLSSVSENATYVDIALPSDEKVSYAVAKRGNLLPITMETIANDDLRTVQEQVSRLGRAARRTFAQFVWNFWINNSTWDVDANVWFKDSTNRSSAAGGNTGSIVWGAGATLTNANEVLAKIQQLALMTERTSAKLIGLPPLESLWLDAPLNMLGTARQLNAAREFGTGNVNPILEMFGPNHERINFNPLFTDTSNWGVHVDVRTGGRESIGVDFYGREEPLMELQDMRTVGDMLLFDRITYKISHIYGGDIIDVYGATKNVHL